jgi:peroxiredoxin
MPKTIIILLLFAIPGAAMTQTTSVKGKLTGGQGQVIRLLAIEDFISNKFITLAKTRVSEDGSFAMTFESGETQAAYLDVNNQRAEVFMKPGHTYHFSLTYRPAIQTASYYEREGLETELVDAAPGDLNLRIWEFNARYNAFVMENFDRIYKLRDKRVIEQFRNEISNTFTDAEQPYLTDYIKYKLAGIEQFARMKGRERLAMDYFTGQPILYRQVEYAAFFNNFFEKYLLTSPDVIDISDLITAVNDKQDMDMIMNAMAGISYLGDPQFRELVFLHGLKGISGHGAFKKEKILAMIRMFAERTTFDMNRKIAINLLETLQKLQPGTAAPGITLYLGEDSIRLPGIQKGKLLLLIFFRSGLPGMASELDMITELHRIYRAGMEIIGISLDEEPDTLAALAEKDRYPFTMAHYGNNPDVYEHYDIRHLPLYVLIDVEGNIAACPAPPPGEQLERLIMRFIH